MYQAASAPQAPAAPAGPAAGAPVLAPGQVTINGQPVSTPQAAYHAFRAQRRELSRQLEELQDSRQSIAENLTTDALTQADRAGLEQRLKAIDERIISLDGQIALADAQVAQAAAIPGAAIELPSPRREGPPEEAFVLGGMLIVFGLLPLSIAYARRIWRRSAKVITTFPQELSDRLLRVEQSVEATALEVERIGEGQRFMTKLFTEGPASQMLEGQRRERIAAESRGTPGA
ncbi:MAG: hypothetical protein ACSLFK_08665 [Gemmatimonadaceae bacterium]